MDAELPPRCGDTSVPLNNAQFEQFPQFRFLAFSLWFPAVRQRVALHNSQQPCPGREAAEHSVKRAQLRWRCLHFKALHILKASLTALLKALDFYLLPCRGANPLSSPVHVFPHYLRNRAPARPVASPSKPNTFVEIHTVPDTMLFICVHLCLIKCWFIISRDTVSLS